MLEKEMNEIHIDLGKIQECFYTLSTRVLNLQRKMSWYDEDKDNKPYTGIDNE
jgi:hypothetical protein